MINELGATRIAEDQRSDHMRAAAQARLARAAPAGADRACAASAISALRSALGRVLKPAASSSAPLSRAVRDDA